MPLRVQCQDCGKEYVLPDASAGKRAKCKCGFVMTIPTAAPQEDDADLYDLAPTDEAPKPKVARPNIAPPKIAPVAARARGGASAAVAVAAGSPVLRTAQECPSSCSAPKQRRSCSAHWIPSAVA
jgi:hypothetical protein